MKAYPLPKLQKWEQFDEFVAALQKMGWNPTQKADGPDARSWAFSREADLLWLVFDDMLGCSLKSENQTMNLKAVAAQLDAFLAKV